MRLALVVVPSTKRQGEGRLEFSGTHVEKTRHFARKGVTAEECIAGTPVGLALRLPGLRAWQVPESRTIAFYGPGVFDQSRSVVERLDVLAVPRRPRRDVGDFEAVAVSVINFGIYVEVAICQSRQREFDADSTGVDRDDVPLRVCGRGVGASGCEVDVVFLPARSGRGFRRPDRAGLLCTGRALCPKRRLRGSGRLDTSTASSKRLELVQTALVESGSLCTGCAAEFGQINGIGHCFVPSS